MQAGAIAGALLANPLADRLGRKPALLTVAVIAFIGGLLQGLSFGHLSAFYIGRFVEGLGLGGATMVAPTYVSENAPRSIRGLLIGFYQLFGTMGAMIAFVSLDSQLPYIANADSGSTMVPFYTSKVMPSSLFRCVSNHCHPSYCSSVCYSVRSRHVS